jgi:flavin reductase (DIM6/NTAB) family NADH-FMN oxidoreductase RutF
VVFEITDGKSHLSAGLAHSPWLAIVAPRPIGWISTLSTGGVPNLAPFSFFNGISSSPPMLMFCANASHMEGGAKDSFVNARDTGEFVHNVATYDLRQRMNDTSATAPRAIDEFALARLTKAPSRLVKPFRVAESPVNVECRVVQLLELPGAKPGEMNHMIIGKVLAIHIRDDLIVDGRLDARRLQPISRLGYLDYATLGDIFEMPRPGWPLVPV